MYIHITFTRLRICYLNLGCFFAKSLATLRLLTFVHFRDFCVRVSGPFMHPNPVGKNMCSGVLDHCSQRIGS